MQIPTTDIGPIGLGWIRQLPDFRDLRLAMAPGGSLPAHFILDLSLFPPIWSQGGEGSCTAHGGAAAWAWDRKVLGLPYVEPSRQFLYWNERALRDSTSTDSGASIRDCFAALAKSGICQDSLWPYAMGWKARPSEAAYEDGARREATVYQALPQVPEAIKTCLYWTRRPVVFGFTVYESFVTGQVARTGLMPVPTWRERVLGGHCVVAVGWNRHDYFLCRNSWGPGWGDPDYRGHFWMPPQVLFDPNMAADFWEVETVSG